MNLSFGRKVTLGFGVALLLTLLISTTAIVALVRVIGGQTQVSTISEELLAVERIESLVERKIAELRGFLLTGDEDELQAAEDARRRLVALLAQVERTVEGDRARQLTARIRSSEEAHHRVALVAAEARRTGGDVGEVSRVFQRDMMPLRATLTESLDELVEVERARFEASLAAASGTADRAIAVVLVVSIVALLAAGFFVLYLRRALLEQVSPAVQQLQTSATELQSSARQQAVTAKEQATATSEITTTIKELLSTSRQISESAVRVSRIAEQTSSAAQGGDETVARAREALAGIQRQVDVIVRHMLDLGRKSQQIGAILEIIDEVAEQTNILAINATIESAGAGEAGRRFAVVADEIRKLADRVGSSTREIRGLVDEMRAAANTTAMATEDGSKAVDAGARRFREVTEALGRIVELVGTTAESAKEIELSTRQQTSAVEQVNGAIGSVAQGASESEAGSRQTLEIAQQLTGLSHELGRIIEAGARA